MAERALDGPVAPGAATAHRAQHALDVAGDLEAATVEVVGLLFGQAADTGEADGHPGRETNLGERAADLMADPARADRVVAAVLEILGEG